VVTLQREQQDAASDLDAAQARRADVHARKVRLESRLHDDLSRAASTLEAEVERLTAAADAGRGGAEHLEALERARRTADECEARTAQHDAQLEALDEDEGRLSAELEELRTQAGKAAAAQADEAKQLDKLLTRRNVLSAKLDEHSAAIRALGSLPRDVAAVVDPAMSSRALLDQVDKINKQLKKYSHVNKKALSQYANFAEQREQLLERKEAVDTGADSIRELIKHLDAQKAAALERTFKDVAQHFEDVFQELVPGGEGRLVMISAAGEDAAAPSDPMEVDGDEDAGPDGGGGAQSQRYSGVSIQVRFAGGGDTQSMQQLSGGQKTMVALCLIFAIQRSDPAPFYLFDEIDANLDAAHRDAVARMVHRQANQEGGGTQFITTTFRPELVQSADKHYGVTARNKMSTITPITMDRALSIIKEEQSVEQQRARK